MSPQAAAVAAQEGLPFAFTGSPNAFISAMDVQGTVFNAGTNTIAQPDTVANPPADSTPATTANGSASPSWVQDLEIGYNTAANAVTGGAYGLGMNAAQSAGHAIAPGTIAAPSSSGFSWLSPSTWGNLGLVAVGAILALGALLISQKQTIVKVGDTAAKTAALLG